ncbi:hypothetical protein M3Y98_00546700 [Aphelenchoides besseyi]|nr:hypothetical protein M3Y98_00546700 [Aphelenchoides besseyi]KAI6208184.1 hypothetical protein M3Y96_00088100 [Aphelenchoides besseyi]
MTQLYLSKIEEKQKSAKELLAESRKLAQELHQILATAAELEETHDQMEAKYKELQQLTETSTDYHLQWETNHEDNFKNLFSNVDDNQNLHFDDGAFQNEKSEMKRLILSIDAQLTQVTGKREVHHVNKTELADLEKKIEEYEALTLAAENEFEELKQKLADNTNLI